MDSTETCSIVLAHSPEIIAEAGKLAVALYLCGHTHGGQICLPGGFPVIANASCGYHYLKGPGNYGNVRLHQQRHRFFNRSGMFFLPTGK